MRCPKCGYTSFDNLERCKKCKKNIAAAATALMGTVASAVAPSFLGVAHPAQGQSPMPEATDTGIDLNIDDANTLDFGSGEDEYFSPDEAPVAAVTEAAPAFSDDNGIDLRLPDNFGEAPGQEEPAIDMDLDLSLDDLDGSPSTLGSNEATASPAAPSLDLAGLDISDLQAPDAPASHEITFDSTLSLDDEPARVQPAPPDADEFSLEDLQVEDLDAAKAGTTVTGDQYQPGMKTGTALDNFNFELDELLELNEDEKA